MVSKSKANVFIPLGEIRMQPGINKHTINKTQTKRTVSDGTIETQMTETKIQCEIAT